MYLANTILLALGVAASVHGSWTIPKDQPDGSYLVTIDEAGNSHHKKIDSILATTKAPERRSNSAKFSPKREIFADTYTITCLGYCKQW